MKKSLFAAALLSTVIAFSDADARGGFSSSGGRGGFSSSSRSSFGSSRSFSGSRSYSAPRTVTTTRTVTRSSGYFGGRYYGGYHYGYGYGWHPYMFGGPFGMGYMYSNGLMEGMIIGSLMHPAGTTVYSGGGYSQPALLYPDGAVVNPQGYQVGTYANGQFAPMANGPLLAQPAPSRDMQQQVQPQPVVIQQAGWDAADYIVGAVLAAVFFVIILAIIF